MIEKIVHSFEAGRRGKPDELDGLISHWLGAAFLELNPNSKFDLDVTGSYLPERDLILINIGGEISRSLLEFPRLKSRIAEMVSEFYNCVHNTSLNSRNFKFAFNFKPQEECLASNGQAGDIGNPIAVAYRNEVSYLPVERYAAVEVRDLIDGLFRGGDFNSAIRNDMQKLFNLFSESGLRPDIIEHARDSKLKSLPDYNISGFRADGKVRVNVEYEGHVPKKITDVTVAVEHESRLPLEELRERLSPVLLSYWNDVLLSHLRMDRENIRINPLGAWNKGGWQIDSGNREAKPYRDGFATYGCCEDSFSGEDPSKPSGTGTFLARYIAVQVVGNGLADFARVALSYTIGSKEVGLNITTNGTARLKQKEIEQWVRKNIPLGINDAITRFNLRQPGLYRGIVEAADFFHNPQFPWNKFEVKYR